jgi:uncharacterized protein (DUF1501 family)
MSYTRRELLRLGLGGSTLLATGAVVPTFLASTAGALAADPGKNSRGRVLVVLQLDGGNDGLNTIVPYADDVYIKSRPRLHLRGDAVARIDARVGFHPQLVGFPKLLEDKQLAIVQSVGYPNPNRSHFESMAVWQTARLNPSRATPGWLARTLDKMKPANGGDVPALHVGADLLPQALAGNQQRVLSLTNLDSFRRRLGVPESTGAAEQRMALDALTSQERGKPGSLLQFIERSTVLTYASSDRLEKVRDSNKTGYPQNVGLARRLSLIAQLIKAGLSTSIYYTQLGGFDTHANQLVTHPALLSELGTSLQAFMKDLNNSGDSGRVIVLIFSEFGRRLMENGTAGTDHGTAAPVLLVGGAVKSGLHGPYPNLNALADFDPKHTIDFRRIYATLLDQWLSCSSEAVLGGTFEALPLLG